MQRPLLWVAICFTVGILTAYAVSVPLNYFLLPALALAVAAFAWPRGRPCLLWPIILLAGAANFTWRTAIIAPNDLRAVLGKEPHEVTIRGTLTEMPYQRVYNRDGREQWRTLALIEVESISIDGAWTGAHGDVIATTPDILADQFYNGQRVQVSGVVREPATPIAPGVFDYRRYLNTIGIHYQLFAESTNDWQLLSAPAQLRVSARFAPWARDMLARGLPHDRSLELLWAMTLGWKTALSGEVSEPFMRSGTMHVFAISGLHIALITAILVATLKLFGVRRATCAGIVIPLIWAYTWATGWQASAIRSTIMSTVIVVGWSLRRPSDLLNSLMAAGFFILVWDPLQLFQAGFQLSFFVVLALALLMPPLERLRHKWLAPDPFLPPRYRTRLWRWGHAAADYLLASLAVSFAAWLGSLPLIAYYFHLFTPISLVANMVVVPLSSAALACNLATLAIGPFCSSAAELFNNSAWLFMTLMVKASEWASAFRPGVLYVQAPRLIDFVYYYAIVIPLFSGWLLRVEFRKWAAGAMVAAAIPLAGDWWSREATSELTVLPLNGGAAVYVQHEGQWLVDCGNLHAGAHITKPFLQSKGVNHLQNLILTHGDIRHVEAAPMIYETFAVRNIHTSPVRFRSRAYKMVQAYFRTNHIPTHAITAGQRLGMWEVLHPDEHTKFPQADDNAIVLFGSILGQRILLLSDLGTTGQNDLLSRYPDLHADIVVCGLPRESEPLAEGFLDVVQPRTIVLADSERERARDRLRARLAKRDVQVIYTSDSGAITFTFSRAGPTIATMNPDAGLTITPKQAGILPDTGREL